MRRESWHLSRLWLRCLRIVRMSVNEKSIREGLKKAGMGVDGLVGWIGFGEVWEMWEVGCVGGMGDTQRPS